MICSLPPSAQGRARACDMSLQYAPGQLSLPGLDRAPTDQLFFAIFPDALTAHRTAELAEGLRDACGLTGRPLGSRRFHVPLHDVGEYAGLPHDVVRKAREAASALAAAPFEIVFDHVQSVARKGGHAPLVLRGRSFEALVAFRAALADTLARRGLRRPARSFAPQMTLLYDACSITARAVEPVGWTVREFVLVHSRWGRTQHIALGRWPLREGRERIPRSTRSARRRSS